RETGGSAVEENGCRRWNAMPETQSRGNLRKAARRAGDRRGDVRKTLPLSLVPPTGAARARPGDLGDTTPKTPHLSGVLGLRLFYPPVRVRGPGIRRPQVPARISRLGDGKGRRSNQ